jgi:NitT/TauT family transport system substrate-binding protein
LPQPGTFKIFCSNPSNVKNVLDEVIVPVASPAKVMADLKGKRVGSGPGIQNVTLAKTVLERGGATGATVVELPIGQHVAALAAGQIDAAYTLEPTGTIGRMNGTTRVLEPGVIARYVLGDPMAPWFGGSASLASEFIKKNPEVAKKFIAAYGKGVAYVRSKPVEARQYMKGYTAIEGAADQRGAAGRLHDVQRVHAGRRGALPEVLRPVQREGHLHKRLMVDSMLYKG